MKTRGTSMRADLATENWALESIRYLRELEFFADWQARSDAAILASIREWYGDEYDAIRPQMRSVAEADQMLLWPDRQRAWGRDLEGVYPGENSYVSALTEWAAVSRGAFTPTGMSEDWHSPNGPVVVSFTFRGQRHTFTHADGRNDFLDLSLLALLNRLIGDTPYQFACSDDFLLDCRFVVTLTTRERHRLQSERGWNFCSIATP
ncbi:MAG TPA: hypothetical protein VFT99_12525 [Roseiflexaceae bacterium]|nr:hypothetical protein [Roseiflexaceae bacterium]